MTTKLEFAFGVLIIINERLKAFYIKWFPTAAIVFVISFIAGIAGSSDRGQLHSDDMPTLIIVALSFTIAVLHYIVLTLKTAISKKESRKWKK